MILKKGDNKKVTAILDKLKHLIENGGKEEELFQEIRSIYAQMNISEKEALFKDIIKKIEAKKEEIIPLLKRINYDMDDIQWSLFLSGLRQKLSSPRLDMISYSPTAGSTP